MTERTWTDEEMLVVATARRLADRAVCFVGVGLPSAAAVLAKRTTAPDLFLVYESGTLGADPARLPLSVADPGLATTALSLVSVPEIFAYWLQAGRIDVGLLGAAQVDRFANVNSTVVGGDYDAPHVRLPGAGGAPEIAGAAGEVVVMIRQSVRTFVDRVDFITTAGHDADPEARRRAGLPGRGPTAVVTDIGILEPDPHSRELVLTVLHPGRTLEEARAATGWDLGVSRDLGRGDPPTSEELAVLRPLQAAEASGAR